MRPRPLSDYPKCELFVGPTAFKDIQPEVARDALAVITMWTHVEVGLAQVTSRLLGAEYELASLTFAHIESMAARVKIIEEAAEHRLEQDDKKLFSRSLARVRRASRFRNEMAHSAVGHASQQDDHGGRALPEEAIVLVPMRYVAQEKGKHFHAYSELLAFARHMGEVAGDWAATKALLEERPHYERLRKGNPLASIPHERAKVYTRSQLQRRAGLAISTIAEIDAMCWIASKGLLDNADGLVKAGRKILAGAPTVQHLEWIKAEEREKGRAATS